jgi:hypothetical protein
MVALPSRATVRLRKGGSQTGRLVRFTPATLTLSAGSQNQTVAIGQVSSIVFTKPEDLWITFPNGSHQRLRPIRGLSLPVTAVPSSAVNLQQPGDIAYVNLSMVLSAAEFAKLTRDPRVLHVLQQVEVSPEAKLALRVRPYRVE